MGLVSQAEEAPAAEVAGPESAAAEPSAAASGAVAAEAAVDTETTPKKKKKVGQAMQRPCHGILVVSLEAFPPFHPLLNTANDGLWTSTQ